MMVACMVTLRYFVDACMAVFDILFFHLIVCLHGNLEVDLFLFLCSVCCFCGNGKKFLPAYFSPMRYVGCYFSVFFDVAWWGWLFPVLMDDLKVDCFFFLFNVVCTVTCTWLILLFFTPTKLIVAAQFGSWMFCLFSLMLLAWGCLPFSFSMPCYTWWQVFVICTRLCVNNIV